jgi:phosphate starvation-inducible PhoH-like protein
MFMLLTRIGLNSKCVVTGDVTQIDLPANKRSGVLEALQALKNVPGIETVYFTGARLLCGHELVRAIIGAYQGVPGARVRILATKNYYVRFPQTRPSRETWAASRKRAPTPCHAVN